MSDGPVEPPSTMMVKCGGAINTFPGGYYYIRHRTTTVVREYSDVVVVGIVLLFLAIVVCVEAVEKFGGNLRNPFCRNSRGQRTTQRHGAIFLADDEEVAFVIPKPFCLQPAPPPRSKMTGQSKGCDSEAESEKFAYDSDAERV